MKGCRFGPESKPPNPGNSPIFRSPLTIYRGQICNLVDFSAFFLGGGGGRNRHWDIPVFGPDFWDRKYRSKERCCFFRSFLEAGTITKVTSETPPKKLVPLPPCISLRWLSVCVYVLWVPNPGKWFSLKSRYILPLKFREHRKKWKGWKKQMVFNWKISPHSWSEASKKNHNFRNGGGNVTTLMTY